MAGTWALVIAAIIVVGYVGGRLRAPTLPETAPDFTLTTLTGEKITLSSLRGKPVVLNFWASWCGPCRFELPALRRLTEARPDVVMLSVSSDEVDALTAAVKEDGVPYPVLVDVDGKVSATYGVQTLPTTIALNAEGRVIWSYTGVLLEPQIYWLRLWL
jgi:cytochrome c biogenesis protein CcmG/thiol:disulfide interchange protein DsbE